jgi:hypothetical protein
MFQVSGHMHWATREYSPMYFINLKGSCSSFFTSFVSHDSGLDEGYLYSIILGVNLVNWKTKKF